MEKKLSRLLNSGFRIYFTVLFLFTAVTFYLREWVFATAEAAIFIILFAFYFLSGRKRRRVMNKYVETLALDTDLVSKDSLDSMPIPLVLLRVNTGDLIWCNDSFATLTGCPKNYYDLCIADLIKGFDLHWIIEGKTQYPELVVINDRYFDIRASLVRPENGDSTTLYAALYWIDCTEEMRLHTIIEDGKHVLGEIVCDNYEELGKGGNESARAAMVAELDEMLNCWISTCNGILRKLDRDRYFFIMDEKSFRTIAEKKFLILEAAKRLTAPNGMPLTLSIGVGKDGNDLAELHRYAGLALEMALSRGGDQAVIKNKVNFEFYGGMTKEIEKRTKVKTRLMANVLKGLLADSSSVYVMGHRIADLDSLGGAIGIVCAARKFGKKAHIVIDRGFNNVGRLLEVLDAHPDYKDVIISGNDAIVSMDQRSLLVVVDTNRPNYVEDQSLLESFNRVAVIDHHRRSADYISTAQLNVHEPAASSVCELIAEMLQYIIDQGDLLRVEASAMLAGIMLDTKSFALKTGSRTFEAAAYLRRSGADSVEVKRLFQSDMDNYIARSDLVRRAEFVDGSYAISLSDKPVDRAVAAQAADDLMNIAGVAGSFVLSPFENSISISARSLGRINVQLIMEKLGGGGHFTTAGAQLKDKTPQEAVSMLKDAIMVYNYEQQ
ncbi:MAG: DHH family phosphoesterase [Clostridia bacterium]|nr:DHH family phosphoesterase [Clostridia bacterium]